MNIIPYSHHWVLYIGVDNDKNRDNQINDAMMLPNESSSLLSFPCDFISKCVLHMAAVGVNSSFSPTKSAFSNNDG